MRKGDLHLGQIRKKESVGIIDSGDDEDPIRYCPNCTYPSILQESIDMRNEPKATDHDEWLQCRECWELVHISEAKTESKYSDVVETSDNRFSKGKTIVGFDNKRTKTQHERQINGLIFLMMKTKH